MNALQKVKLTKELLGLVGALNGGTLKALEKVKTTKRVLELVALLGGIKKAMPQNIKQAALIIQANTNGLGARSIYKLSGDKKTEIRRAILGFLTGENPPISKAGVSVIADKLNDIAGGDITGDIFGDWIDSAAKGIYLDVEAYYKQKSDKENAIESRQKEADVFGAKYPLYADNDYFPFTTKGAKNGEWRFIIGDNGKINVRYFNGSYIVHLDDFSTLESAYQALQADEDYQDLVTPKDHTPFLQSIINNEASVVTDKSLVDKLGDIANEADPDLLTLATVAAARQVIEANGRVVID